MYYYTDYKFHQAFNILQGHSIVHLNCRRLFSNFEEIRADLIELRFTFDVIILSETWINTKQELDLVQLSGCQLCYKDRQEKRCWSSNIHWKLY